MKVYKLEWVEEKEVQIRADNEEDAKKFFKENYSSRIEIKSVKEIKK